MKHLQKFLSIFIFLSALSPIIKAQTDTNKYKIDMDLSADLYSRYIWRGTQFGGNSPSIQPGITATWKNLELGAWGAYSLGGLNPSQEMDLYLDYTFANDKFTVIVTDYYFPRENSVYDYFEYDKDKTGHIFEGGINYNGADKCPFSFSAYVNFYGADAEKLGNDISDTATFNKKTGIQYSNYFEFGYNTTTKKDIDVNLFLGLTLNNPLKEDIKTGFIGETGFYGSSLGVVNLGITASKKIKIRDDYSLPITASLITNPQAERVYLIFGISF